MVVFTADDVIVLPDDVSGRLDPSGLKTFFTSGGELSSGLLIDFLIEFAGDDKGLEEDISTVGSNDLTAQVVDRMEEKLTVRPGGCRSWG